MAIVKVDEYYICKMVVSLWLVFGEFVSFPFGSSKVFPKNFYMMGTIAYFFWKSKFTHENWILEFPNNVLWCLGSPVYLRVLPQHQLSCLTPIPLEGAEQAVLPQAGTDKCSPEMSAPLICVGLRGPVPLLCVATEL